MDEYFASHKGGLSIVGYYHANERFDDYELSSVARKIGDHITRSCPQAGIFLVIHSPSLVLRTMQKLDFFFGGGLSHRIIFGSNFWVLLCCLSSILKKVLPVGLFKT